MPVQHSRPAKYPRTPMVCSFCDAPFLSSKKQTKDRINGRTTKSYCSLSCSRQAALAASSRAPIADARREEHFWSKVDRSGNCWVWIAALSTQGYGRYHVHRKAQPATHVAWQLATGEPVPTGGHVLHVCDNPRCVRNDEPGTYLVNGKLLQRFGHLVLGTSEDNMGDAAQKGRVPHGVDHHNARLTPEAVAEIRRRYTGELVGQGRALAAEFGVSPTTISAITHRRAWRHVP